MTSIVAHLLLRPQMQMLASGRQVRFGETTSSTLTRGPLRERILSCLSGAAVPMRLADITEAIKDYDSRASKTLAKLVREGLVESIGPAGYGQRFRLI